MASQLSKLRWPHVALRWPHVGPRRPHVGPRWCPRWFLGCSIMGQIASCCAKIAPRWPEMASCWPEMAPCKTRMAPSWSPECPTWDQDDSALPQDGLMLAQNGSKLASKWFPEPTLPQNARNLSKMVQCWPSEVLTGILNTRGRRCIAVGVLDKKINSSSGNNRGCD